MKNLELSELLNLTGADGALLVSAKGELLKAENIEAGDNISAMLGVLVSMCRDFSSDIGTGDFKQLMIKSSNGMFIVNEINDFGIVGLYSKDIAKGGLMKIALDKLVIPN